MTSDMPTPAPHPVPDLAAEKLSRMDALPAGDYRDHLYRKVKILPKVERTRKRPGDLELVYERGEYVARRVAA